MRPPQSAAPPDIRKADPGMVSYPTQGVQYAGSKLKLLPAILEIIRPLPATRVLDGFSGSTRVSQALAQAGYTVHANDAAVWSEVFATCFLKGAESDTDFSALIGHLNGLPPKDSWYTRYYGGSPKEPGIKRPWQRHNTRKLDAIRTEIDRLALNEIDRAVALTSLMLALDDVDNTIGHQAAYLSRWSPRSYKNLQLKVPALIFGESHRHRVSRADIFEVLPTQQCDLAYFDPPYGSNNEKMPPSRVRYSAYYHLWTTLCLNDQPELFGKANRRVDSRDTAAYSVFEDFRKADSGRFVVSEAIERLLQQADCPYILLSYSSGGRATFEELTGIIESVGTLERFVSVDYRKNVMAGMSWTQAWTRLEENPHQEFLFLIRK